MNIKLKKINKDDKSILENMFQLYMYDITRFLDIDINKHGLYQYDFIDCYWINKNYYPYFIYLDNKICGFVLIDNDFLILEGKDKQYNLSEFFILNKYRRKGIGKVVANKLFDMYKGEWEIRPIPRSPEAYSFWDTVIKEYTKDNYKVSTIPNDSRKMFTFSTKK